MTTEHSFSSELKTILSNIISPFLRGDLQLNFLFAFGLLSGIVGLLIVGISMVLSCTDTSLSEIAHIFFMGLVLVSFGAVLMFVAILSKMSEKIDTLEEQVKELSKKREQSWQPN